MAANLMFWREVIVRVSHSTRTKPHLWFKRRVNALSQPSRDAVDQPACGIGNIRDLAVLARARRGPSSNIKRSILFVIITNF